MPGAVGGRPSEPVPTDGRRVYDVRDVIESLVDGGDYLELSDRWARNMVTAMARIDGRPVGVIANQPRHLGGVIDAVAAEKAALFVSACNRFRLPLIVLVDTPGFMPGRRQESAERSATGPRCAPSRAPTCPASPSSCARPTAAR